MRTQSVRAVLVVCTLLLTTQSARRGLAHPATSFVVGEDRALIVSDIGRRKIWRIHDGDLSELVSRTWTHWMELRDDGFLYFEDEDYQPSDDTRYDAFRRVSLDGNVETLIAPTKDRRRFTCGPFTFDRDGRLYFAHGETIYRREESGPSTFLNGFYPRGMAWNSDGALLFTHERSLYRRESDGNVMEIVTVLYDPPPVDPPVPHLTDLWGFHLDAANNVYVADPPYRRLLRISPDGSVNVLLRSDAPWFPTAAYVRNDTVYVQEFGLSDEHGNFGPRIQALNADGSVKLIADLDALIAND